MYTKIPFVIIPLPIIHDKEISRGSAVLYGRLNYFWMSKAKCMPKQETLAYELNTTERTIRNYLKELENVGLLRIIKGKNRNGNEYKAIPLDEIYEFAKGKWIKKSKDSFDNNVSMDTKVSIIFIDSDKKGAYNLKSNITKKSIGLLHKPEEIFRSYRKKFSGRVYIT